MRPRGRARGARFLLHAGTFVFCASGGEAQHVELISTAHPSRQSDAVGVRPLYATGWMDVSADGRFVTFHSEAPNVVAGQVGDNARADVFLHDRMTGTTILVSRAAGTVSREANGESRSPVISADGGYVAFSSEATDLVTGLSDGNGTGDVFVFERATGTVSLASHVPGSPTTTGNDLASWPFISADGAYVAFEGRATDLVLGQVDTNGGSDVFLFERASGTVTLVSHAATSPSRTGNVFSFPQGISSNGRQMVFVSYATDLVGGQVDALSTSDVFLFDRVTGATTLVSHRAGSAVTAGGGSGAQVSADGDSVAFVSDSDRLVTGQTGGGGAAFLFDRPTGTVTLVSHAAGSPHTVAVGFDRVITVVTRISPDGGRVLFESSAINLVAGQVDANDVRDVFLFERASGTITLISHAAGATATAANAGSSRSTMSDDARWIAFVSGATDLAPGQVDANPSADVFVVDRAAGTCTLVSRSANAAGPADAWSHSPFVSAGGQLIAFVTDFTDLDIAWSDYNEAPDIVLHDTATGLLTGLSRRDPGLPSRTPGAHTYLSDVSSDGRFVVFQSSAVNVVAGQVDTPGSQDVFLFDRVTRVTTLVSHRAGAPATAAQNANSGVVSGDGRYVAFVSSAPDLVPATVDGNGRADVFLFDRVTGATILVTHAAGDPARAADAHSLRPLISHDGRYIAFYSAATDLVPGQLDTNGRDDVFLFDRLSNETILVSRSPAAPTRAADGWSYEPSMDASGDLVAFTSDASDLVPDPTGPPGVQAYLFSRTTGQLIRLSRAAAGVDVAANGASFGPVVSADGNLVAFRSSGTDLVPLQEDAPGTWDLFLYTRASGIVTLVTRAAGTTARAAGTVDLPGVRLRGGKVAFSSVAADLVAGQDDTNGLSDVFLFDSASGTTTLVSHSASSPVTTAAGESFVSSVSRDGQRVAFSTDAPDVVAGVVDENGASDVFVYQNVSGPTVLASRIADGTRTANGSSSNGRLTDDGDLVVFESVASDLLPGDFNQWGDVFAFGPVADPGQDDVIFADSFESGDLSSWSVAAADGGDLAVAAEAAMAGTALGLHGLVDDRAALFVQDLTPAHEPRYRARFYLDPAGFDPGETAGAHRARVFLGFEEGPTRRLFALVLKRRAGQYGVMARVRLDDNSQAETGFFDVSPGPHVVEIEWQAASAPDVPDGEFRLWIDDMLAADLTALRVGLRGVDSARLGALNLKTGAFGTLQCDHFESRRRSYIGP